MHPDRSQGPSRVTAAAWFPDGRRCITGFQNGSLLQWDGTTFQYLGNNNLHGTPIRCITWAHNGRFFLCGDGNLETKGKIIYWSPTLQPLQVCLDSLLCTAHASAWASGCVRWQLGHDHPYEDWCVRMRCTSSFRLLIPSLMAFQCVVQPGLQIWYQGRCLSVHGTLSSCLLLAISLAGFPSLDSIAAWDWWRAVAVQVRRLGVL